jgi:hypothetical protein
VAKLRNDYIAKALAATDVDSKTTRMLLRVFKMGKKRKSLVLAPLAPITASRTSLHHPHPTPV